MTNYTIKKTPKGYLVLLNKTPVHVFNTRKLAKEYVEKLKG